VPNVLSPEELKALAVELARPEYAGLDVEARWQALHTPEPVPNPVKEPPQVPVPFDAAAIESLLGHDSLGRFFALPLGSRILDVLNSGDSANATKYAYALTGAGVITPDELGAILARVAATQPDPAWTPTVPGPTPKQRLFGAKAWEYPKPEGAEYLTAPVSDMVPRDDVAAAGGT
jgi:hypothetical protein